MMLPAALLGLLLASPALAQPEVEPPPLSGPEVVEQRIEGVEAGFSSMMAPGRVSEPVPMGVFREAVEELAGDAAPQGARLTAPQSERLRAIHRGHGREVAAYRRQHAAEIAELRQAIGPLSDRRRDDLDEKQRAAMVRLREIRAGAPHPEAMQARVWAELSEAQRAHVQSRIDEHRAKMAEQRQAAMVERLAARLAAARAAAGAGAGGAADSADAAAGRGERRGEDASDLAPELRETLESLPAPARGRLAQLPPERRARILKRLSRLAPEERAQALRRFQGGAGGRADARRDRPVRDRRSPPPMEWVNVPDPNGN